MSQTEIVRRGEETPELIGWVRALEEQGLLTETLLDLPGEVTPERFWGLGQLFGRLKRTTLWWIGDWIMYGEVAWGERYEQIKDATGLELGTLQNYRWVCDRVPRSRRRRELSFGHHHVVAGLEGDQQAHYLERAVVEQLTRDQLRKVIRAEIDPAPVAQPQWSDVMPRPKLIEEAARDLVHAASDAGDGTYRVPSDRFDRLAALVDEDAE